MADATVLNLVLYLPLIGIALLVAVPPRREGAVRAISLAVMLVQLALTAVLYVHYDSGTPELQFATRLPWIPDWGVYYYIGLDGYNRMLK